MNKLILGLSLLSSVISKEDKVKWVHLRCIFGGSLYLSHYKSFERVQIYMKSTERCKDKDVIKFNAFYFILLFAI